MYKYIRFKSSHFNRRQLKIIKNDQQVDKDYQNSSLPPPQKKKTNQTHHWDRFTRIDDFIVLLNRDSTLKQKPEDLSLRANKNYKTLKNYYIANLK